MSWDGQERRADAYRINELYKDVSEIKSLIDKYMVKQEIMCVNHGKILTDMQEVIRKTSYILNGNGTPGLVAKVSSLEEKSLTRDKHIWALVIGVVGSFATALITKFMK